MAKRSGNRSMHALGQFMADQLEHRGWTPSELARASGLTKQSIWNLMDDRRVVLGRMIEAKTVKALARAFEVEEDVIVLLAAQAMGVPLRSIAEPRVVDPDDIPDEVLLVALRRRLKRAAQLEGREGTIRGTGPRIDGESE